jgi:two-component system sensor histidine kinase FlrB
MPAANLVKPNANAEDEQFLLRAFRSFAHAADSLERSYSALRIEVGRLRTELEHRNADLARSFEENRQMRDHLDRILEGLPCGVLVAAGDGRISRINPEAVRMFGIEDASDLNSLDALSAPVRVLLGSARKDGREAEIGVSDSSGSTRWLAARHAEIPGVSGSTSVFILRDVSERKRLEEAQARLERERALAEMSAVLAHEIRNPLGSMELFAGLLAESKLEKESRAWVEQLQAGLRTLAATVNNVLHFHSLPKPNCAPVDLGRLLDWTRDFLRPLAHQSNIKLSLQNGLHGVFLSADRHRLEQVLFNLLLNAVRAMPGGGWIEVQGQTARENQAVFLTVADTGPGIPAERLRCIFEPGFSTSAGSGLGLAVSRKIVEQHGGSIEAKSIPGYGTRFILTFPLPGPTQAGESA